MRVLLTGSTGQVGGCLLESLAPLGEIVAPRRAEMDLSEPERLIDAVEAIAPDLVVNAAAYTAVDAAEADEPLARAINAEAPGRLAEAAARLGVPFVHYSTDYVFDGTGGAAHQPADPTGPLGVYGRSKLAGEQRVAGSGASHLILRTSWVYGRTGRNFMNTMLRLAESRDTINVVADQFGAPTSSRAIAEGTTAILSSRVSGGGTVDLTPVSGVYHLTCGGSTSWHGFAEAIFRYARPGAGPRVVPITTAEYPTPARRPANSVLDCSATETTFGVRLPEWEQELQRVLG